MLDRLKDLAGWLAASGKGSSASRIYVDTGPILERSHAHRGGLGFIGKNTMLIDPRRGSFFFLGVILSTLGLSPTPLPSAQPGCGTCTRCLQTCPTQAFPEPMVLDARRCISYLTIEHKGFIPVEMRPLIGNWIYGCDICQTVCPWQRFAEPGPWAAVFAPSGPERAAPWLADVLAMTAETFNTLFRSSPIWRIGRDRLVRNACIAAGNSGNVRLREALIPLLHDPNPLVRGHAAWALGKLGAGSAALRSLLEYEEDRQVRLEITQALQSHP
jgi:epoxyqueuosine reductase